MGVRAMLLGLGLALVCASAAQAAAPIMALSEVTPGMRCTGLTVVRGTTISRFRVDVIDVVAAGALEDARILVRVSGPAVEGSGIAAGFSGSPVYCRDAAGVERNVGAISAGVNQYGDEVGLVTPIEEMLGQPVDPPAGARRVPAGRPLAVPLTVSGLSGRLADVVRAAAAKAGRPVFLTAGSTSPSFPVQELRPGASVSVGDSSGAIASGAVGTVTYRRGDTVWVFGHPLDFAGRRSLLLQDAYVYDVIDSPLGALNAPSYKLAASGHDVGTVTGDGEAAVTGKVGSLPDLTTMRVTARDRKGLRRRTLASRVADESALGWPGPFAALEAVTSLSLARATITALGGSVPSRAAASMCLRIEIRERAKPIRFCNRYLTGSSGAGFPGQLLDALSSDADEALTAVKSFAFGPVHVTDVDASVRAGLRLRQTFMTSVSLPKQVRRGQRVKVKLTARDVDGGRRRLSFRMRVPSDVKPGERTLTLTGTGTDGAGDDLESLIEGDLSGGSSTDPNDPGPESLDEVADSVSSLRRYDGVRASFEEVPDVSDPLGGLSPDSALPDLSELDVLLEGDNQAFGAPAFRAKRLRVSGQVSADVRVLR